MEYLSRFPVPNYVAGRKQDTRICYDRRSVCRPRNQNSRGR